jgi:hypothetical protein
MGMAMTEGKYVIMLSPVEGEFPILFSTIIKHHLIVHSIVTEYPGIKCVAAGFFDETFNCYGKSVSLNIGSRNIDTILLRSCLPYNSERRML